MSARVLIVTHEALFFTTHRLPIARALLDLGCDVHVAVPHMERYSDQIRDAGFDRHLIPLDRGGMNPLAELRLMVAFALLFRRVKPDLVHLVGMKPVVFGGTVARLMALPACVIAVTGLGFIFLRAGRRMSLVRRLVLGLYRFALGHRKSRAIFQNPDDLALFTGRGMVDPARVAMIRGCGPDLARFTASAEPGGKIVVMFPARFLGDKGVREFVEAARALKAGGSAARFVLVGRNDPLNPTNVPDAEIRSWVEAGVVENWGFSEAMPATLARAHIVCMPSYREGLPRGLLEAAACARPIVTADVPGCREVVHDGDNGYLVPVRDAAATADAIARLIDDGAARRRMGARGREIVEREFSEDLMVSQHIELYRALLGDRL